MRRCLCLSVGLALSSACGNEDGGSKFSGGVEDDDADSDTEDGSGDATEGEDTGDDDGPKYDVGGGGGPSCDCEVEYVWIANSEQSTVSKIDVDSLDEVGRYLTRADEVGNPSRTSVSLSGDVAVANRHGGLVKYFGDTSKCKDFNGTPGIQTSSGAGDVLAWDQEECRAWFVDMGGTNQRPVAWAQGDVIAGSCDATDEKIWTVTSAVNGLFPGMGSAGGVKVYLVDGDNGEIDKQIQIDTFPGGGFGAYGGAVDSDSNFYFTSMGPGGVLGRVDADNFVYQLWDAPSGIGPYGITVDHKGRVWVSSNSIGQNGAARFDPETETWDIVSGFWGGAGLAEGPGNLMWISSNQGVSAVDLDSFAPVKVFATSELVKGLGFDSDGFMIAATYALDDGMGNLEGNDLLWKVDTGSLMVVEEYGGLERPYTYSDMTGYALGNVTCPPEG